VSVDKDKQVAKAPTDKLRAILDEPTVQDQFKRAMAEHASAFMASIVELVATDNGLQECPPSAVIKEALKAATLDIPLNRSLGFAYILPFNKKDGDKWVKLPQFIPGYKLYIQLAHRSKEYDTINADMVYEGQVVEKDTLTGRLKITGAPTSEKVIGYVAFFQLKSGFSKAHYMTREAVQKHAEKYSKAYGQAGSPWRTEFDAMALKTVLKHLLSKYGPLSIKSPITDLLAQEDEAEAQAFVDAEANVVPLEPPADPQPTPPAIAAPPQPPF
jgi:recombination protein RecT